MLKAREFNIPELNSFVNGIKKDIDSVKNSFTSRYSNGLLEGKINKVKGIKRMSYGGCKRTTILLTKSHKKRLLIILRKSLNTINVHFNII